MAAGSGGCGDRRVATMKRVSLPWLMAEIEREMAAIGEGSEDLPGRRRWER